MQDRRRNFIVVMLLSILLGLQFIPIASATSFSTQISANDDDAEEQEAGNILKFNNKLELVYDAYLGRGNQTIGLRFINVNVPPNAIILKAYLKFTADSSDSGTTNLAITAQDSRNPLGFSTSKNDITSRTPIPIKVNWSDIGPWSSGNAYQSPDLSAVLQYLVNQNGWSSSNPMVFMITGTGQRVAKSRDSSASDAPLLYVEYTQPSCIFGKILYDGSPLKTKVSLSGNPARSVYTDTQGNYCFEGLSPGSYVVTPTRQGYTFNPLSKSIYISSTTSKINADFECTSTYWTYNGVIATNWDSVPNTPLVGGEKPYPPTAIAWRSDTSQFLIIKNDKVWWLNKYPEYYAWGSNGFLNSFLVNAPLIGAYSPDADICAVFYVASTKTLTLIRRGNTQNGNRPMYWTFIFNPNHPTGGSWGAAKGYLSDLWQGAAPLAFEDNTTTPYTNGGPSAVTYMTAFDAYLIINNNAANTKAYYWLRKDNAWIASGELSTLFKDAPGATTNYCNQIPTSKIIEVFYGDGTNPSSEADKQLSIISGACGSIQSGVSWLRNLNDEYDKNWVEGSDAIPDLFNSPLTLNNYLKSMTLTCKEPSKLGALNMNESINFEVVCKDQTGTIMNPPPALGWILSGAGKGTMSISGSNMKFTAAAPGGFAVSFNSGYSSSSPISGTILDGPSTLERWISKSTNDTEETESGGMLFSNDQLELVYDSNYGRGNQKVGFRFENVTVPKNARITKAYLEFKAYKNDTGAANLTISAQGADTPLEFSTSANISSRSLISPVVPWSNVETWSTGNLYRSPDITLLVQNLVNRNGWVGDAMVFIVSGTGTRTAKSFDDTSSTAPLLHIEYQPGGLVDTDGDGFPDASDDDDDNDLMPDAWEMNYPTILNPLVNDANLDPDHDGFTNIQEYYAGTIPNDPNSPPPGGGTTPVTKYTYDAMGRLIEVIKTTE